MSPFRPGVFESASQDFIGLSAHFKPMDLRIRCVCNWSVLFLIVLSDHSTDSELRLLRRSTDDVDLGCNSVLLAGAARLRGFLRYDGCLSLHLEPRLRFFFSSLHFIIHELLLLDCYLLLHLVQFLLSILYYVVYFCVLYLLLGCFHLFFSLSVNFIYLLHLLLDDIFWFFFEPISCALELIAFFGPKKSCCVHK
jgi:hypothetical protein